MRKRSSPWHVLPLGHILTIGNWGQFSSLNLPPGCLGLSFQERSAVGSGRRTCLGYSTWTGTASWTATNSCWGSSATAVEAVFGQDLSPHLVRRVPEPMCGPFQAKKGLSRQPGLVNFGLSQVREDARGLRSLALTVQVLEKLQVPEVPLRTVLRAHEMPCSFQLSHALSYRPDWLYCYTGSCGLPVHCWMIW